MVNLAQPINNRDMVRGLNDLIRLNVSILSNLDDSLGSISDKDVAQRLRLLREMHERHILRIGETVRVLGGAPVAENDWRRWIGKSKVALGKLRKSKGVLAAISSEEGKLRSDYARKKDQLKASPEVVATISELLDEGSRNLSGLDQGGSQE